MELAVYKEKLFVGTMDWSYVAAGLLPVEMVDGVITVGDITLPAASSFFGADMFAISEDSKRAKAFSLNGMGNNLNYGVRTMEATSNGLVVGTANPMNLNARGGWELIGLK